MWIWTISVVCVQNYPVLMLSGIFLHSGYACFFNLLSKEHLSFPCLQAAMAAVDSFYLLYREIARSCNCYMEALALVGAWYTARKSITVICDFYSLIRLHFVPRLVSRADLVKQYGRWAVVSGKKWDFSSCLISHRNKLSCLCFNLGALFKELLNLMWLFVGTCWLKKTLCYDYVHIFSLPSSWKNFPLIFVLILPCLTPSIAPAPPSYALLFLFALCFEIVITNCHHFQKCFPYFKYHLNVSFPRKVSPGTCASQKARHVFENSFLLCLLMKLVDVKQLFGYLSDVWESVWLACVIHVMTLCLTDQY